jgi:hypothetical protein
MKKYMFCLLAACIGIAASAFTTVKKPKAQTNNYVWFEFNGGLLQMWDPDYYSVDPNQYPECYYSLGLINCEIKALPQEFDADHPDLTTIISCRYRPLL